VNSNVDCTDAEVLCEETGLDLAKTDEIAYQPIADGNLDGLDIRPEDDVYKALADSQETVLRDALIEKWEVATSILKLLKKWKEHPEPTDPAVHTHEKIIKQALEVTADVILDGANAEDVTDEHTEVMRCLYCLGQWFLQEVYDEPNVITGYRGLGYNLPHIAKQILETDDTEYTFDSTVVTNFTGSEARSLAHSRVQIQIDVEPEGIVLPLDQLFKHREGDNITERDGELQVCGDVIPELSSESVYVVLEDDRRPLQDLLRSIPDLAHREHFTVRDIVIEMAYRGLQLGVDEDESIEDNLDRDDVIGTLEDWFTRFAIEYPDEALVLQDLYEYVIGERSSRPDSHNLFQDR
jgi:hypothetical protein